VGSTEVTAASKVARKMKQRIVENPVIEGSGELKRETMSERAANEPKGKGGRALRGKPCEE